MSAATTPHQRADGGASQSALEELGRVVLADTSMPELLQRVVDLARVCVSGVSEASVSVVSPDRATTVTSTGALAVDLDETQYAVGFGPCLDAAQAGEMAVVPDTAVGTRWPDYCRAALAHGVRASLSVPVPLQQGVVAALNLYAPGPGAFDDEPTRAAASSFAAYVGVALTNARGYEDARLLAEQLRAAMESRAVIEQAKGVLMGQRRCSAPQAFDLLVSLSQSSNRKLRDVAQAVDSTHC